MLDRMKSLSQAQNLVAPLFIHPIRQVGVRRQPDLKHVAAALILVGPGQGFAEADAVPVYLQSDARRESVRRILRSRLWRLPWQIGLMVEDAAVVFIRPGSQR